MPPPRPQLPRSWLLPTTTFQVSLVQLPRTAHQHPTRPFKKNYSLLPTLNCTFGVQILSRNKRSHRSEQYNLLDPDACSRAAQDLFYFLFRGRGRSVQRLPVKKTDFGDFYTLIRWVMWLCLHGSRRGIMVNSHLSWLLCLNLEM
jgi:hypothetical protein